MATAAATRTVALIRARTRSPAKRSGRTSATKATSPAATSRPR